jgi:hypothetical protein
MRIDLEERGVESQRRIDPQFSKAMQANGVGSFPLKGDRTGGK